MLMTIFVMLVFLWLLGVVTSYTLYGFIHLLLVLAVAVMLIRIIQAAIPYSSAFQARAVSAGGEALSGSAAISVK